MKLKLSEIVIDKGTQAREKIDQKTVTEYSDSILEKNTLPPLDVFYDGIYYYLVDGFHRYFAYNQNGIKEVDVEVQNGTLRNAIQYSLSANSKHGLKRTKADKNKSVVTALNDMEWSLLTNREIAKICDVSHTFVSMVKDKLNTAKTDKKKPDYSQKNRPDDTAKDIDTEFTEDDKLHELLVQQKDLEQENIKLQDQLALKVMDAPPELKKKAEETIAELRAQVENLEREVESLKISRDSYMKQNAEMQKQLNFYKRELKKVAV